MKIKGLLILLLLVSIIKVDALNFIVSGSGYDGTYYENGTYNGKPIYYLNNDIDEGGNPFAILWVDMNDGNGTKWHVGWWFGSWIPVYTTNAPESPTPPSTGWDASISVEPDASILTYSPTSFNESLLNDGSIKDSITITHNGYGGETFTGANGDDFIGTKATITNLPSGLTASLIRKDATTLTFKLNGIADASAYANSISNVTITFDNSAFTGNNASSVINSTQNNISINFINAGIALDFDGVDDYVDCGTNITSALVGTHNVTAEAWVRLTGNSGLPTIIGNYANGNNMQFLLRIDGNKPTFWIGLGGGDWHNISGLNDLILNKWTHIAGTWDGSEIKIYVNGILENSAELSGSFATNSYSVRIGWNYQNEIWQGQIDEVRIWNTTRTESQIRECMMKQLAGNEAGLLAYYNLNETSGTTAHDLTSNHNDGTLIKMNESTAWVGSGAFNMWTGTISSAWNTPGNWSQLAVPVTTDNVGLCTGTNEAILSGNPTVNNMVITSTFGGSINSEFTTNGNLFVTGTSTLYGGNATTVSGILGISNGATLNVPYNGKVTLAGNTINDGTLVLKSSSNGTATLLTSGTFSGTGTNIVEQYLTGTGAGTPNGRFWYIASPVESANSSVFDAAGDNKLWSYSELTQSYTEITDNTSVLNNGKGYVARLGSTGTMLFSGTLATGDKTINLTRTGTTHEKRGYDLVGNPYPSFLNWDSVTKTNVNSSIWYRTQNNSGTMVFDTYNAKSGIGTINNGNKAINAFIPPMQAFWVLVDEDGNSGTLEFDNSMRSHQSNNNLKQNSVQDVLRLQIANGKNTDEAILVFNNNAINTFDAYDSQKMFASNSELPQVFTYADTIPVTINGMTTLYAETSIPVGISIPKAATYSISLTLQEGFENEPIFLEDKLLQKSIDISKSTYEFQSDTALKNNDRFVLHLKAETTPTTGVKTVNDNAVNAFSNSCWFM